MRLNEILIEQKVNEAPQGMLSRIGSRVKAWTGDKKAAGELEAGKEANWLRDKFETFLGKIGKDPTPQMVIDFLKKNNYPTGDAEQEMTKVTTGQKIGSAAGTAAGAAAKGIGKIAGALGKGVGAVGKGIADVAKGAVAGAKDAVADPKQDPNAQTTTQQEPKADPDAQKQPEGNPDNIAIKGQKGKKIVPPSEQNKTMQAASIDWSNAEFIFENAEAVLSGGQLDKIFMAAVRQAIARDEGGQRDAGTGVAPADAQGGGFGGALKSAGQSAKNQFAKPNSKLPPEIADQLSNLPARDKQQLLKML
jgi:hypothetical protein